MEARRRTPSAAAVAGRERARDARGDDRAHDRDPERAADLAEAVQHGRADAGLVDAAPTPIAAAVIGVIAHAIPTPPRIIAGQQRPEARVRAELREAAASEPATSDHAAADRASREPTRSESRPAMRRDEDDQHRPSAGTPRPPGSASSRGSSACRARRRRRRRTSRATTSSITAFAPANVPVLEEREVEHRQPLVQLEQDERDERDGGDARRGRGSASTSSRSCSPRSARR